MAVCIFGKPYSRNVSRNKLGNINSLWAHYCSWNGYCNCYSSPNYFDFNSLYGAYTSYREAYRGALDMRSSLDTWTSRRSIYMRQNHVGPLQMLTCMRRSLSSDPLAILWFHRVLSFAWNLTCKCKACNYSCCVDRKLIAPTFSSLPLNLLNWDLLLPSCWLVK